MPEDRSTIPGNIKYRFCTAIPGLRHQLQGDQADIERVVEDFAKGILGVENAKKKDRLFLRI
jgi:hypothetical protein